MTHMPFIQAIARSEQLLTAALLTFDRDDYERYMQDALAISEEWRMTEPLRASILEAAHENTLVGRSFNV